MDQTRVHRIGNRPYRSNFMPSSNARQAIGERLHGRGISTSSNSSWTFSNSHSDIPKPKKGRLCGIFLIGAIFVVVLAVLAIGGLAFYMGAMRIEAGRQDLLFDGSLRITYGDQFQTTLSDHSNKNFQEKASRYSQMLTSVFQKSAVGASLHEVNILKFENGSLIVHFRINLDRRKIPSSIVAVEDALRSILIEEISSVKPIAFRNLQVDKNNLFIKRYLGEESNPEHRIADRTEAKGGQATTKKIEIKNGVVRKISPVTTSSTTEESETEGKFENEPTIPPDDAIIETFETVQNFTETVKTQIPEIIHTDIKSIDFNNYDDNHNKTKVYQSVYVTSDNFEIKNGTTTAKKKDDVIEGSYKVTKLEGAIINNERKETNGHAKPITSTTTEFIVPEYSDEPWRPIIPSANPEPVEFRDSYVDIYDSIISEDQIEDATEEVIEEEKPITFSKETYEQNLGIGPGFIGKVKIDSIKNNKLSRITEDIAKKYKDLLKNHRLNEEDVLGVAEAVEEGKTEETSSNKATEEILTKGEPKKEAKSPLGLDQMISGIRQVEEVTETTKSTTKATTTTTTTTEATTTSTTTEAASTTPTANLTTTEQLVTNTKEDVNITVKNPFVETDDSRASTGFNFGIPDFPILKQFHHLDSLLKSFSSKSAGSDLTQETVTRFPARTKPTSDKNYRNEDKIYIAVSTISPEDSTRQRTTTTTTSTTTTTTTARPIVIKGEVEVLDEGNKKNITFDKIPSITTTEVPKLITLLPVRSNVNMKRPLRPRPKPKSGEDNRKSKMNSEFRKISSKYIRNQTDNVLYSIPYTQHHFVDDKDGKRWIYYSSSKLATSPPSKNEKLFIVTPEPKTPIPDDPKEMVKISENSKSFSRNLTRIPIYNTIETLLNADYREREALRNKTTFDDKNAENKNASEIIDKIVKIMENVAISTGNSTKVIVKVNQTVVNHTNENVTNSIVEESNNTDIGISTKAVSSNYKVNQAGVPVLTKVLNKAPVYAQNLENTSNAIIYKNGFNESLLYSYLTKECDNTSVRCGNGACLPASTRCNQLVDCPDAADEKNCTCSEHLKAQHLHRKLCDGIVDCWDFTDEYNCEWCKEKEYLCSNSRMCITKSQICDGVNNCPFGDDERYCVTVSPSKIEANSFNYHSNGYLMVRKHGNWGKLCIDNFENVSMESKTGWKISDLGRSVCKALTFKDFDQVERMISVPNEGRSMDGTPEPERYYELSYNNIAEAEAYSRDSLLSFHETECTKKEVIKVTCTDLECGLRPKAVSQVWSRIVGGGNANPGAWPWQAALYKEGEFQCGATLISPQWLISAGHCFYHNQDEYWVARLGTLRTTSSLPSPYEQLRQISKIILHPQYIDTGFINDISLLKMSDPVTFTDYVRPICLPKSNTKIIDGMMCTVVGWGQLFEIGRIFPDTLQEVQLPIISSSECQKRTLFLTLYKVTDDMFCAGYERGGRDACLGDSGGPLMCQESDGKWSLYGVTSNGYGCARSNRPGVYTKVSRYLHWIQAQMNLHAEDEAIGQNDYKYESYNDHAHFNRSKLYNSTDKQQADVIIKLISEKIPNVKFATSDGIKARDKCKGHRCPLGECLPKNRLCNGYIECSDGSDEKDCW